MRVDSSNISNITSLEPFYGTEIVPYILLIVVNVIVILTSTIGNAVVLYASTLYHAIKMDKTSVIFLENLAVADILLAIIFYGPITITLVTRRWVLGSAGCWINAFFTSAPSVAEILILTSISIHRIWLIRNPFSVEMKPMWVKSAVAAIWIISFAPGIVSIFTDMVAYYDPWSLSCISSGLPIIIFFTTKDNIAFLHHICNTNLISVYGDESMKLLVVLSGLLLIVIPMLAVIMCNVFLLHKAISTNRRIGRQSVSA